MKKYVNAVFAYQLGQLVMNTIIVSIITSIEQEMLTLPKTSSSIHKMGGREFLFEKREIGHIHWDGDLDILFTKAIKEELFKKELVQEHKWVPNSGWTTFHINSKSDIPNALKLLHFAYLLKAKRYDTAIFDSYKKAFDLSFVIETSIDRTKGSR